MPSNVVRLENMSKHLTKEERKRREQAESAQCRRLVRLLEPDTVKEDPRSHGYWKKTVALLKGLDLLDNADADMLGKYCTISARSDMLTSALNSSGGGLGMTYEELLKRIEASERMLLSYAEKLGLTPTGRARLAVKKAQKKAEDPDADLYGDE